MDQFRSLLFKPWSRRRDLWFGVAFLLLLGVLAAVSMTHIAPALLGVALAFMYGSLMLFLREATDLVRADASSLWALSMANDTNTVWPAAGGWALEPRALTELVNAVTADMETAVELGPGVSTFVLGRICPHLKITALEHSPEYADRIERRGASLGISDLTVLRPTLDKESGWYEESILDQIPAAIDILIIDGPPDYALSGVRGKAELLVDRLRPGGLVLVDDAYRPKERALVNRLRERHGLQPVLDMNTFVLLRKS